MLDQQHHSSLQYKWLSKLLGLDYEIQYKKGVENTVGDALSRTITPVSVDDHCVAITASLDRAVSIIQPDWVQQITQSYVDDNECQ